MEKEFSLYRMNLAQVIAISYARNWRNLIFLKEIGIEQATVVNQDGGSTQVILDIFSHHHNAYLMCRSGSSCLMAASVVQ